MPPHSPRRSFSPAVSRRQPRTNQRGRKSAEPARSTVASALLPPGTARRDPGSLADIAIGACKAKIQLLVGQTLAAKPVYSLGNLAVDQLYEKEAAEMRGWLISYIQTEMPFRDT